MSPVSKYIFAAFAAGVAAYPSAMQTGIAARTYPNPLDVHESNSGIPATLVFDAKDQFVDVRPGSSHEFVAPGKGDLRGPCPGLNAAANHAFISHSGIVTTPDISLGLLRAFGMSPEFAAVLSAIAIALSGDPILETWSIGGCNPSSIGLLSNPGGLSYSHNKYESDASPGRGDAYLHDGDAHTLQMDNFNKLYDMGETYTLDIVREHNKRNHAFSIANNPYFFAAPFGSLVPPAAYNFIPNFFSNHSEEYKSGILERHVLKSFFAVSGPRSNHVYHPGHERIPDNWYRRSSTNLYDLPNHDANDNVISLTMNPEIYDFGGNMGKVNSFVGVDLANLTGGVFTAKNLADGNNIGCLFLQSAQAIIPDYLHKVIKDISPTVKMVAKHAGPLLKKMGCPELTTYNSELFKRYPGYHYNPSDPKGCATSS